MPKVAIIVPTCNQARFLRKCVDSALTQTFDDLEVIVVDDGSIDDTPAVAGEFDTNDNFKYFRQENMGVAIARNRGMNESAGEYLCFLDSDDFYHPKKVALQASILDENPDIDFVYCDIVPVDENGRESAQALSVGESRQVLSGNIFSSLFLGRYFPTHTVMVRRAALNRFGQFDISLGAHADYELWLRLAAEGCQAYYLDRKLAFCRLYSTNMSKDIQHMNKTRNAALEKITRCYPGAVANAVFCLQRLLEDQHAANVWLRGQIKRGGNPYYFLDHLQEARLMDGRSNQLALWNVEMNGSSSRALFLHPPAKVLFPIRDNGSGRLIFAIGMHPDIWGKAAPGGCLFSVTIDEKIAFQAILDSANFMGDRQWLQYELEVPESPNGVHIVRFQTSVCGNSAHHLWALWREPALELELPMQQTSKGPDS